jgi:hypothetical protein
MTVLQDGGLYEALKTMAKKERRSISQEVIMMIESYIRTPKKTTSHRATEEFLNLSWVGDDSAEEIINELRSQKMNSKRFESQNDLYD